MRKGQGSVYDKWNISVLIFDTDIYSFIISYFQRITQICRLLGKPDQVIQKKLNGCLSVESLDKVGEDDNDLPLKIDKELIINGDTDLLKNDGNMDIMEKECSNSDKKSDTESGFEEMSKSVPDDLKCNMTLPGIGDCHNMDSSMTSSASAEQLNLDYLILEVTSVALDWQSFRNVPTCSCASPFDRFTKKASYIIILLHYFDISYLWSIALWKFIYCILASQILMFDA